jgi:hypothetical protein
MIMGNRAQRFGIDIGRGWVILFLIGGTLLLAAYWIGPLRPLPAHLELLAIDGDVAVPQFAPEPGRTADGGLVFAVPLAARNIGSRTARPASVVLSLPAQYRLATTRGPLVGEVAAGVPLRRYVIALPEAVLAPDSTTRVLTGLDTIFLQPDLPRYYCMTQGPQIPEFTAAPDFDAQTLSDVRIFYSFNDPSGPERQTGLLTVRLDPELLEVEPAAMPPSFRTTIQEPEAQAPDVGRLRFAGARTAHCGDPERPIELFTVLWETQNGGQLFVVYVDNVGRKRLYDLNRDGIIELETWDGDADGLFEARREARYATPAFLLPLPPRDPSMTQPDPVPPDARWLALFHRADGGPRRFAQSSLTAHPQVAVADTAAPDSAAVARQDSAALAGAPALDSAAQVDAPARPAAPTAGAPVEAGLGPVRQATPQFLALFADTSAGPFRFSRQPPPPREPARQPAATAQIPAAGPDTVAVQPVEEDTTPPPPRPRPRRPPLGTPIIPPR